MSNFDDSTVDRILTTVAQTAIEIRTGLTDRRSQAATVNPSGDIQLNADIWADEQLATALTGIDGVGAYASEERTEIVDNGSGFTVAVDPLDGSKNLRSSNCLGIIVGIYDGGLPTTGRDLVAAVSVVFGAVTTMMSAVGGTVEESILEAGTWRRVTDDVTLPSDPTVYGVGGHRTDWSSDLTQFVDNLDGELKCRYGGAMVGDVNQVLTFGGLYGYPAVDSYPNGKLRVLFEAAPMAYIVEAAGGRSTTGDHSVLDVTVSKPHQRSPVMLGNSSLVSRAEDAL